MQSLYLRGKILKEKTFFYFFPKNSYHLSNDPRISTVCKQMIIFLLNRNSYLNLYNCSRVFVFDRNT